MKRRRAEAEEKRGEAEEETRFQDQRRSSMISTQYPVFIRYCKNCCKSPVFKYRRFVSVKTYYSV